MNTTTYNMEAQMKNISTQITYLSAQLAKFNLMYTNTPVEAEMSLMISQFEMDIAKMSARLDKLVNKVSALTYNYRM